MRCRCVMPVIPIVPIARRSAFAFAALLLTLEHSTVSRSSNQKSHLERETGLEPATPSLEGWCSSHLSYSRMKTRAKSLRIPSLDPPSELPALADSPFSPFSPFSHSGQRAGGERRIRTSVGASQQIYSLPRLTASVSLLESTRFADRAASPPSLARVWPRNPGLPISFASVMSVTSCAARTRLTNESVALRSLAVAPGPNPVDANPIAARVTPD